MAPAVLRGGSIMGSQKLVTGLILKAGSINSSSLQSSPCYPASSSEPAGKQGSPPMRPSFPALLPTLPVCLLAFSECFCGDACAAGTRVCPAAGQELWPKPGPPAHTVPLPGGKEGKVSMHSACNESPGVAILILWNCSPSPGGH